MKLKRILWIDFFMGFTFGCMGMIFFQTAHELLQIPVNIIVFISVLTFLYSLLALSLAMRKSPAIRFVKILVMANWLWSIVSAILLFLYFSDATILGEIFLVLQILVVAGFAYMERKALK